MARSYQRLSPTRLRRRAAGALLATLFALAACRREPPPSPLPPLAPADAATLHLDAVAHELVDAAGRPPRILADELAAGGSRAVELRLAAGAPRVVPLAPAAIESRSVAAFPHDDRALVEVVLGADPEPRLRVRSLDGSLSALGGAPVSDERFLGWLRDGTGFTTAGRRDGAADAGPAVESLFEVDARSLVRREIDRAEPGFAIAAVDTEARLVALVRRVEEEADELVLRDRRSGESRLLLPSEGDGRFRPLLFLPDGDLLLTADDGSDEPRLERLAMPTASDAARRRPFAPAGCPVLTARLDAAGGVALELACDGRREAARHALDGSPSASPATPAGTRAVARLEPGGPVPGALTLAGPGSPPELAVPDRLSLLLPLTRGLPARLASHAAPSIERLDVASGRTRLPCELRSGPGRPRAGIAWLVDDRMPARFDEYLPLAASLAARDVAILRCRGRGADGFGRAFRRAADGAPGAAALEDLRAAAGALRDRLGAAPLAVAGEGEWWGAAALALASGSEPPAIALAIALFPAADPLAPFVVDGEPARGSSLETTPPAAAEPATVTIAGRRWSIPAAVDAAAWRFPVETARVPALVALDAGDDATIELAARVEAAAAAGAPVAALRGARSRLTRQPRGELARALAGAIGRLAEREIRRESAGADGARRPPQR